MARDAKVAGLRSTLRHTRCARRGVSACWAGLGSLPRWPKVICGGCTLCYRMCRASSGREGVRWAKAASVVSASSASVVASVVAVASCASVFTSARATIHVLSTYAPRLAARSAVRVGVWHGVRSRCAQHKDHNRSDENKPQCWASMRPLLRMLHACPGPPVGARRVHIYVRPLQGQRSARWWAHCKFAIAHVPVPVPVALAVTSWPLAMFGTPGTRVFRLFF